MEPEEKRVKQEKIDISHQVMREIRDKKIQMRPAFVFLAQKLGLQSILALSIVAGALLLNVLLYFLKKTSVLKFLSLGWPGLKVVLVTLPYDYIILFIITIVLANYIIHQLDLSHGLQLDSNVTASILLLVTVGIGIFFAVNGVQNTIKGWSNNRIPTDTAVSGRIIDSSANEATIEEDDGKITDVILDRSATDLSQYKPEYLKDKVLRAIGERSGDVFHADEISCCDSE